MFSKSAVVNHDHKRSNTTDEYNEYIKIMDIESKLFYDAKNILCDELQSTSIDNYKCK